MNTTLLVYGDVLLSILDENGKPAMEVPASLIAKVRHSRTMPFVHRQPTGAVLVRRVSIDGDGELPPVTVMAPQSKKVM